MPSKSDDIGAGNWQIADLIDFEYLLVAPRNSPDETKSRRAEELFQSKVLPTLRSGGNTSRPVVFRSWLNAHRDVNSQPLPGEYWNSAWHFLIVLSTIIGLVIGGSMTATLLFYNGGEPVNVTWFFACTLGIQVLILFAAATLLLLRRTTGFLNSFRPLRQLLVWAMNLGLGKLPGEQRERLRAVLARLDRRREIYGSLMAWPFMIVTQVFGVGFNLGILGVLLANIAFKDVEFGWQSSFIQSDEAAFALASGISTPWKWAPNPHPTLVEVANSHFRYKERLSNKKWWPFLCYSVLFYGLLVRGGLLVFAILKLRIGMRKLSFDHEGCASLYRRLIGPTVSSVDTPVLKVPAHTDLDIRRANAGEAIALVSTDVRIAKDHLTGYIQNRYGWHLSRIQKAQIDHPSGNAAALAVLTDVAASLVAVVVVAQADRPPIKAIAIFLEKVIKAAGAGPEVIVLLVGKSGSEGFASSIKETFGYWQNFVAIHKLQLSLEKWVDK